MFEIRVGDDRIIHLSGRLDAAQVEKAEAVLGQLGDSATADLSGLDYISSAGISVLLRTFKRLHDGGASLKLTRVPPRILTVFQFAGLDKIFVIE